MLKPFLRNGIWDLAFRYPFASRTSTCQASWYPPRSRHSGGHGCWSRDQTPKPNLTNSLVSGDARYHNNCCFWALAMVTWSKASIAQAKLFPCCFLPFSHSDVAFPEATQLLETQCLTGPSYSFRFTSKVWLFVTNKTRPRSCKSRKTQCWGNRSSTGPNNLSF